MNKKCILILSLVFSISLIAQDYSEVNKKIDYSLSSNQSAMKFYNKGLAYFNEGNYKKALPKFKKAVKIDAKFTSAWNNIGLCHKKEGNIIASIKSYKSSLEIDPKGRLPLMNISIAYEELKDYQKAIKAYKRFLEIYSNDAEGTYGLSRMYLLVEDYENALDYTFLAFWEYEQMKSPKIQDAQKNISLIYNEMKEKGSLDIFNRLAKKHKIGIE